MALAGVRPRHIPGWELPKRQERTVPAVGMMDVQRARRRESVMGAEHGR